MQRFLLTYNREHMERLNYHHLLYFWTVARTGSIANASKELLLAPPTSARTSGVLRRRWESSSGTALSTSAKRSRWGPSSTRFPWNGRSKARRSARSAMLLDTMFSDLTAMVKNNDLAISDGAILLLPSRSEHTRFVLRTRASGRCR